MSSPLPRHSMPLPAVPQTLPNATVSPTRHPRQKYKKLLFCFGISEVVLGGTSIVFAIAAAALATDSYENARSSYDYYNYYNYCSAAKFHSYFSPGIWCGLFMITVGILGIVIKKKTSRAMYIANMAMGIITATVVSSGLFISGLSASTSQSCSGALVGLHIFVAILCFAAFVITILHAAFCCSGVCFRGDSTTIEQIGLAPQAVALKSAMPYQYVQGPDGQITPLTVAPPTTQLAPQCSQQTPYSPPPTYINASDK